MTQFGLRFIIGDVKGNGIDAVGRCAAVLAVFRELAFGEPDLIRLAEAMDARLSRDMEIEDFVTVILAAFAPGHVRIVNCGHHPPVKLAAGNGHPRSSRRHGPGRTRTWTPRCAAWSGCCSSTPAAGWPTMSCSSSASRRPGGVT